MLSNLLTSSRLSDGRACSRLERIKYGLGYRAITDNANLRFGTLFHAALEVWWLSTTEGRLEAALAVIEAADTDPFDRARADVLMRGYDCRWAAEPYRTVAVEAEFRCPLINPATGAMSRTWKLGGKIDVIAIDERDGLTRVLEHKTASGDTSPGSKYWERLALDAQISIYFDGAQSLGYAPVAVVYDVINKPATRPMKATPFESRKYHQKTGELYANQRATDETPDEYRARLLDVVAGKPEEVFRRGEIVRLEDQLKEARFDHWFTSRRMRDSELAGYWPRNVDACVRYGSMCSMFPVCSGTASLEDPGLYRHSEIVHPELGGP